MKKFLVLSALLSISHTAMAENVGLEQAMEMANGVNTGGKCYADKAPQSNSGYRVYCTDANGNPQPAGGNSYITSGSSAPAQYYQVSEDRTEANKAAAAWGKKVAEFQRAREAKPIFTASITPTTNGDDWFDNKGQVTRVSRNWDNKKMEPAKDNGTFRIAIEKVILNGAPAVRVFETHGMPVCGKGICAVNIDTFTEHTFAKPSYFTTLRGAMQPGPNNDAYIIDEEVVATLWDAPYYVVKPLTAMKKNVRAVFDTEGFRARHRSPRVVEAN